MRIIAVLFLLMLLGLYLLLAFSYPTTSPINSLRYFLQHVISPHKKQTAEVFGFLPYWRTGEMSTLHLDSISEITFFTLTVKKDGTFETITNNQTDPGWREWNNQNVKDLIAQTQIMGDKFNVTVTALQNPLIESILQNKTIQETLISGIIQQINNRHLNGVTIDFEFQGSATNQLRTAFVDFATNLRTKLNQNNKDTSLSLSVLPSETNGDGLLNLKTLSVHFDRFIGMSYDFYGVSSSISGPVAPMHGFKEKKFFFDVTTMYNDLLQILPANKILMGIPYYGWDRTVKNAKLFKSTTFLQTSPNNYAAIESYSRMRQNKYLTPASCQWDTSAQEKWCWYIDKKTSLAHQVWLEENKSLKIKFDFARQQHFAGIAIWGLGYDNGYLDIWNMIDNTFTQ